MFSNGDAETFKALVGDDYLTISADRTIGNKAQTLESVADFKGSTYRVVEQTDRVYGNVVMSSGRAKFYYGSILVADVYFNQTWIFRNGTWQFINWQGTMTGAPKNYPIYLTLIPTFVVLAIIYAINRYRRRKS